MVNLSDKKLNMAADEATTEAMNVFKAIVDSWKDKKRSINGFDHLVVAKIAEQFIGFSYFTIMNAGGREGADAWLKMALGFIETTVSSISKAEARIPLVWVRDVK